MSTRPSPALVVTASIPAELVELLLREEMRIALGETSRLRGQCLLLVASISAEEGGVLLGISSRSFRSLMERHDVAVMPLGHKTARYRLAEVSAALDSLAVATSASREALRGKLIHHAADLLGEVAALAA